jgi:hypothetical protein
MPAHTGVQVGLTVAGSVGTRVRTTGRRPTINARALVVAALFMTLSALAPLLSGRAWAQTASFHIVSDGTAKYSYTEEQEWETLGFDDSAWPFVVAPSGGLCDPGPVPPGAPEPIWGEDPQEFQTIFVRKTFSLNAAATANIIACADDDYDLFINGVFIGGNHDGFAGCDLYTNVPLPAGLNVLAMMAVDSFGGCQSLSFDVFPPPEPPANDDVADAIMIPDLPFTDTRDTRGATTAPDDPGSCFGGPFTNVWYAFTPSEEMIIRLSTAGSTYEACIDVFASSAEGLSHTGACGSGQLDFVASAGTTYYFMVSSPAFGGDLVFSVLDLGAPLQITLSLNATGSFDPKTGVATVGGTVGCNVPRVVFDVNGTLQQRIGRVLLTAQFSTGGFECTPPKTAWRATASSPNTLFTGGKAMLSNVFSSACNEGSCDDASISGPVTVKLSGKKP